MTISILTPGVTSDVELADPSSRLAFWKQILPMKKIRYTAKDGSRQTADFSKTYLQEVVKNKAVDNIGFLLADADNKHTMDPEKWRGSVVEMQIRENCKKPGLYGKIVFPSKEAAQAVMLNPDLPVSARIRPSTERDDGSVVGPGIVHVLGTLDPQVQGMSPWEATDLSMDGDDVLDLSGSNYESEKEMPKPKTLDDYTSADIDAMTEEEVTAFLLEFAPEMDDILSGEFESDDDDDLEEDEDEYEEEDEPMLAGADLSREAQENIDLARQEAAEARSEARAARQEAAEARWEKDKDGYLAAGVPPFMLDLAAPVLARPDDMVIDLSREDTDNLNVGAVVRGLLDAAKGTVDLSVEKGHSGTISKGENDDYDEKILAHWEI